ncbi:MAG: hypothetical protein EOM03_10480 [Clostridia bacterium]|nr:hypothetical protein [Clostridia bacterium]
MFNDLEVSLAGLDESELFEQEDEDKEREAAEDRGIDQKLPGEFVISAHLLSHCVRGNQCVQSFV